MYVCSCFGITEAQVREHAAAGACTPRRIASASKAGTDCGSCVRRIQSILGRGGCPSRELLDRAAALPSSAEPVPPAASVALPDGSPEPAFAESAFSDPAFTAAAYGRPGPAEAA
ncbi:(2Fe-2S)-binding protein [Streptomyces sp. NRRL F-5135]|uniref:(2Fe-2S)-binding protein n=1 Tax=Streptomyces sp. NRRL F-5135 TaxID=1463858 RepID=UPI0004C64298|nr:(2Fe-2S)-binding protein [Streptomyces sp. NRRL F-5135]